MKGKRTGIEFDNHGLLITRQDGLLVHCLKKPKSFIDSIKFINTNGVLVVTGDYSNWLFDREFHPSADGGVSDYYWIEKMRRSSTQEPMEFDSDSTQAEIEKLLLDEDDSLTDAEKEYLDGCLNALMQGEFDYEYEAHRHNVGRFQDHDAVPHCKKIKMHLQVVFDGFDEICRRIKNDEVNGVN